MNRANVLMCSAVLLLIACRDNEADPKIVGESSGECTEYNAASSDVEGQLFAYFALHDAMESSVFSKIRDNGGYHVTGFPRLGGKCHLAFKVQGVVSGNSYNVEGMCPILESVTSDSDSSKKAVSRIDVERCET